MKKTFIIITMCFVLVAVSYICEKNITIKKPEQIDNYSSGQKLISLEEMREFVANLEDETYIENGEYSYNFEVFSKFIEDSSNEKDAHVRIVQNNEEVLYLIYSSETETFSMLSFLKDEPDNVINKNFDYIIEEDGKFIIVNENGEKRKVIIKQIEVY